MTVADYNSPEVVAKYAAMTSRVKQLNNAERALVDTLGIHRKTALVIGAGTGRIPANLLLFGNRVTGVEKAEGMLAHALRDYPSTDFTRLTWLQGDSHDLSAVPDRAFDFVYCAAIDFSQSDEDRNRALSEATVKLKTGGILAFNSHNLLAHAPFSREDHLFVEDTGIGGGRMFFGTPDYIASHTAEVTGLRFIRYFADTRRGWERTLLKKAPWLAERRHRYLIYAFRKT